MPKIHIDEVFPKRSVYPMLINFQNGYITDQFKKANICKLYEDENTKRKCVAAELNDMLYTGDECRDDIGKTLVLARNRQTGKVRLIEVGSAQLKPNIKINNEAAQLLETSFLELSRKFGSKKQKQKVEHREKLKVNESTVAEQMHNVTVNITEDKLDISSYNQTDSDNFYIPQMDRNATKLEEVYDIHKILTEEEIEKIHSEIEFKDYAADFTPFIKSIVDNRKLSMTKTVLAVYANSLLKYAIIPAKNIKIKNYQPCPQSKTLSEIILKNFSVMGDALTKRTERNRPLQYRDKSLCYVIVLALLINGFKFEIEKFCEETKWSVKTFTTKIKVTGATVTNVGKKKIAQLKLPLPAVSTKESRKSIQNRRKSAKF